jgi:NADPH-dependent ferric siderophore reductase
MSERHQVTRIRRERRRRALTVTSTERLSPHMLRLCFTSPDLADFESAAADDHVKLFVPDGAGGVAMRDYTPRAFDTAARTLTIDFALHQAGPATAWALGAKPGDTVQIGGPQGSNVVADDFDWYLLIGDETALPAIARRLEELRPGVPVRVLALVDAPEDQVALPAREGLTVEWRCRGEGGDDAGRMTAGLDAAPLPAGEGYVWIAAEASLARALRAHVIETLGHPREWVKAAGYWMRGVADAHERIGD